MSTEKIFTGYWAGFQDGGNALNATPAYVNRVTLFVAGPAPDGKSLDVNYLTKAHSQDQQIKWARELQKQGAEVVMSLLDTPSTHWNDVDIPAFARSFKAVVIDGPWGLNGVDIDLESGMPIVQGGLYLVDDTTRLLPAIPLESTAQTGLRHTEGTVSMARFDVNSARAEFFIVLGDQPHLDHRDAARPGYAAFGRVVDGMDLVREIRDLPVEGERLKRPIPFSAKRVD